MALPTLLTHRHVAHLLPYFLSQVLAELRRLMPGKDPVAVLLADPSGCLDMQVRKRVRTSGLGS